MKINLRTVSNRHGTPIPWWGYAGIEWTPDVANVYILKGKVTEKRAAHELTHPLEGDHHPWWHFCLRSFHGFRSWRHRGTVSQDMAQRLIRDGWV